MPQLNIYLNFNGNCREAMTFYRECFGGELMFQTVGETPIAAQCPTGMHHQIMHSSLTNGNLVLMGSDMLRPEGFIPGNDMTLSLNCESEEEIETLFGKLSEGGQPGEPLSEKPWGGIFGAIADKFGKRWMLNYQKQS